MNGDDIFDNLEDMDETKVGNMKIGSKLNTLDPYALDPVCMEFSSSSEEDESSSLIAENLEVVLENTVFVCLCGNCNEIKIDPKQSKFNSCCQHLNGWKDKTTNTEEVKCVTEIESQTE